MRASLGRSRVLSCCEAQLRACSVPASPAAAATGRHGRRHTDVHTRAGALAGCDRGGAAASVRTLSTIRQAAARAVISHALQGGFGSATDERVGGVDDSRFHDAEDAAAWRDIVVRRCREW